MRRRHLFLLAMALLAACQGGPVSYLVATPQPVESAYACALRKVNQLGYVVTNTNKEAGFITADKQTTGAFVAALSGQRYHDQITISVFEAGEGKARQIRATSARVKESVTLIGTQQQGVGPSDSGKQDANDILLACGEGPVSKQGALEYFVEGRALAH